MRPIDADAFIRYIDPGHLRSQHEVCFSESDVVKMIDKQPTIDVAPVEYGRWQVEWISKLDTHTGEYWEEMYYRCDACDHVCDVDYPYCPHCGAEM